MRERCPDCDDTGWKPGAGRDGAAAVVACACRDTSPRPARLDEIGVPPHFVERARFDYFDEIAPVRTAKQVVERWAEAYPDVKAGLLLTGATGVGKTHLAVAALRHLLVDRKIAVRARFEYVPRLLRDVQRIWSDPLLTDERRLNKLARAEIVVFDQLGADTGWDERARERLLYVLHRCFHHGCRLICTTAFPLRAAKPGRDLADQITERGVSLLREACRVVPMEGEDYRDKVIGPGLSV